VGEVSAVLRKGVLYRCSQIYTQEVLKDLKIRTVVDLRGRAEKGKKKQTLQRTASGHMAPVPSEAAGSAAAQGTPAPLLPAEARDALAAADANAKLTPEQHQVGQAARTLQCVVPQGCCIHSWWYGGWLLVVADSRSPATTDTLSAA
jgi:hypothetical protein